MLFGPSTTASFPWNVSRHVLSDGFIGYYVYKHNIVYRSFGETVLEEGREEVNEEGREGRRKGGRQGEREEGR